MSNKVSKIFTGLIILALGILIAVFGGAEVFNVYIGVLSFVLGILFFGYAIFLIINKKTFSFAPISLGAILLWIGIAILFTKWLSFSAFVSLFIVVIIGLGSALALYSISSLTNKKVFVGIGQLVVGVAAAILGIFYFVSTDFHVAFWIIIGVLIAVYGAWYTASVLFDKKSK